MGLGGSYAPCFGVFSSLLGCCRAEGGHGDPPLHGHTWLAIGRGVPMAQLERVPRGQQEPSPYPSG